jgi:hypothetical protein
MLFSSCQGYSPTPCDGVKACHEDHTLTPAELATCITKADTAVTTCQDECSPSSGTDVSGCEHICLTTHDASIGLCAGILADCEDACPPDDPDDPTDTEYEDCVAGCNHDYDTCTNAVDITKFGCDLDCESANQLALYASQKAYLECTAPCCGADEDHPSHCEITCQADNQECLADPYGTYVGCQQDCFPDYYDDGTVYTDCQAACQAEWDVAQDDCSRTAGACGTGCKVDDIKAQLYCGYGEVVCNWGCEQTYADPAGECLDAQTEGEDSCSAEDTDCVADCAGDFGCIAECGTALGDCLGEVTTTYQGCIEGPNSDRLDCRLSCCEKANGHDEGVECWAECWHGAGCDADSTTCKDSLQGCLQSCPDFKKVPDSDPATYEELTCNPCQAAAIALMSVP